MIHVDRALVAKPKTLSSKNGHGKTETALAILFYSNPANLDKSFEAYEAYNEDDVKESLNVLFDYKCAYCEIDYGGAPMDVEHYRPKGAVIELDPDTYKPFPKSRRIAPLKPGYYWLAARWENLLPSCIDCNRRRTHGYQKVGHKVTGKGNYFPLAERNARARRHTQHATLRREEPLLLNPCEDDPSEHLHFGAAGNIVADSVRGAWTVEVLGLQRELLVRQRKRVLAQLRNSITNIKKAKARLARNPANALARGLVRSELKNIRDNFLDDSCPYLAMCRAVVLEELGIG